MRGLKALGVTKAVSRDATMGLRGGPVLPHCDFLRFAVADFIGERAARGGRQGICLTARGTHGRMAIAGARTLSRTTRDELVYAIAGKPVAVSEAGRRKATGIFAAAKGAGSFITEISMDEAERPQEAGRIGDHLAAIADAGSDSTNRARFEGGQRRGLTRRPGAI